MLTDSTKCKKVMTWSGDFGMDKYVSWCLPFAKINLDTIWTKFEEFCKPQAKSEQGLTCFQAFIGATDQWLNGTTLYKLK